MTLGGQMTDSQNWQTSPQDDGQVNSPNEKPQQIDPAIYQQIFQPAPNTAPQNPNQASSYKPGGYLRWPNLDQQPPQGWQTPPQAPTYIDPYATAYPNQQLHAPYYPPVSYYGTQYANVDDGLFSTTLALVLCIFLGILGVHRFYTRNVGLGILYLFTFGLCLIGVIVDIVLLVTKSYRDGYGRRLI